MSGKQIDTVKQLYRHWVANSNLSLEDRRDLVEGWVVLTSEPQAVDYLETDAGVLWPCGPSRSSRPLIV